MQALKDNGLDENTLVMFTSTTAVLDILACRM